MYCDHRLPNHGMMFVRSGVLTIETDKEHIEAHAGDYIFWRRNCTARMKKQSEGDTPFQSIAIALDSKFLKSYFSEQLQGKRLPVEQLAIQAPAVPLLHNIKIDSLFMSLIPYADQGIEPDSETIQWKQREAVNILLEADHRMYATLFDFHETWKIDLAEFMEQHFMLDMTMEEFASYTGRSLATFKRDFKKFTPLTPEKWLVEQRLDLSSTLLRNPKTKPSDVYFEVGFKSRTHFSGLFKQRFGLSPAAYQQKYIV
ncbi:MAG: AraC family transcriptional regulator [Bacteroidales bacterium]|nr:AraC family transcriptional regulator [Bacteroidales bacterium]